MTSQAEAAPMDRREPEPTPLATEPPPPPPPVMEERGAVTIVKGDDGADRFLAETLSCPFGEKVSIQEFLDLRVAQARSYGIKQHYLLAVDGPRGAETVRMIEEARRTDGAPLTGISPFQAFAYSFGEDSIRLERRGEGGDDLDPIAFMRIHRDVACNVARMRRNRSAIVQNDPIGDLLARTP